MVVYNLEDPNVWIHTCDKKTNLFKKVMLMAFHNLVIIQCKDMMRYAIVNEGISPKFHNIISWIMFTYNAQHSQHWML
jgi:hypothetical protein